MADVMKQSATDPAEQAIADKPHDETSGKAGDAHKADRKQDEQDERDDVHKRAILAWH